MPNEWMLKYGCNPNQKPSRIYMADGSDLPVTVLNGRPGYINFLDALNSIQLVRELKAAAQPELDLRGMAADEAIILLDNFLDSAYMGNLPTARIIHGKGTGVLRAAVHDELRRCKYVKSFRLGVYGEGESGVTVVTLK